MAMTTGITPRRDLDFGFSTDMPRHWAQGDAFKSRLLDAFSLQVPIGERMAMRSVQAFASGITDATLADAVRAFMAQEGQHSLQHRQFNDSLAAQGVAVHRLARWGQRQADGVFRVLPRHWCLALMAGVEHLNAVFGRALLRHSRDFSGDDPRALALHVWHGAEEWEHRAVCFEVLRTQTRTGRLTRVAMYAVAALLFPTQLTLTQIYLLRVDGLSWWGIAGQFKRHWPWLWGRDGFFRQQMRAQRAYLRGDFHPSHQADDATFTRWEQAMAEHGDPLRALSALQAS